MQAQPASAFLESQNFWTRYYATPIALYTLSLWVFFNWRDVALHIMSSPELNWLAATPEEFEFVDSEEEADIAWERDGVFRGMVRFEIPDQSNIIKTVCYPGRITMAPNATSGQIGSTKFFYYEQLGWRGIRLIRSRSHYRHAHLQEWVDVTQFKLNESFTNLFRDAFEVINGLFEISLQYSCLLGSGSTWDSLPAAAMNFLATQYLTQPPVISLNISIWIPMMEKQRLQKALHIVNVRNDHGIRVSGVLAALRAVPGFAVEHWKHWARLLHAAVENGHLQQDFWVVDGRLKLLISLDPFVNGESSATSLFYLSCMHALSDRDKRQEEWIPRELWSRDTPE